MAKATYHIEVFSRPLNQWLYAHTYAYADGRPTERVVADFVANNPHRDSADVRVRAAESPAS